MIHIYYNCLELCVANSEMLSIFLQKIDWKYQNSFQFENLAQGLKFAKNISFYEIFMLFFRGQILQKYTGHSRANFL